MRLFTAIELPQDACDALIETQGDLKRRIGGKVSWTSPNNLHVTLKFLGEVAGNQIMRVGDALMSVAVPRFSLSVPELGTFPQRGAARVLFADVAGEVDAVSGLFNAIDRACEPLGFEREKRAYHPHITLARFREPRRIAREIEAVKLKATEAFEVREFVLMQSRLSSKGAVYERVATVALL